jgi:WD40 repeat protein
MIIFACILSGIQAFVSGAEKFEIIAQKGHTSGINDIAFSPDDRFIISASKDYSLILWNAVTGKEIRDFTGHTDVVNCVAFSPDGKMIASGSADKTIKLWDVLTGRKIRTLTGYTASLENMAFSKDGKFIASRALYDKSVMLRETATGNVVRSFSGPDGGGTVTCFQFTPDGRHIAVCSTRNKAATIYLLE